MPAGPFLAAPSSVERLSFRQWTANEHWWTTADGDVWDISSGASGVVLNAGVRGMNMPPIQRYASKSPAQAGSRWHGFVTDERKPFWPLEIYNDGGSQAWIDHNRRFWSSLLPYKTGEWTIVQPGGEARSLTCRFEDDGDPEQDLAAEVQGWFLYGITLVAEQPYWKGEPVRQSFRQGGGPVNFLGGGDVATAGFGPPFVISSGSTLATASIGNPGQLPVWPTWTLYGPFSSASVGVGSKAVVVPFSVPAGSWLRVDTRPGQRRALVGTGDVSAITGTVRTRDLGPATDFSAVDPGEPTSLAVSMIGTGRIEVEITPLYYQAY